jgi:spore coat polysaccharide biosynthesis protein SpsF (cytidylyltransferase family)
LRTVVAIQARMGSTRLPGKVLERIGDRPLVLWTVAAARAIPDVVQVVLATTTDPVDDPLVDLLVSSGVRVWRGPDRDVLTRIWDAVRQEDPDLIVRATADNPFMDPEVVAAQVDRAIGGSFDYVGTTGWPLGIAAEVARASALCEAVAEARDPAEREHVMPFLYGHPERFRLGSAPPSSSTPDGRFTVDTAEDLAFARAIAARLGAVETSTIGALKAILDAEPALREINASVRQKPWQEIDQP